MSVERLADDGDRGPQRVDETVRQVVSLLELVRREDEVLAQLSGCVTDLRAIRAARAALLNVTTVELVEARDVLRELGGSGSNLIGEGFVRLGVDEEGS